uniref:DNA-(apurinic or apyrimidinic site) endonuclease n=1 Tax=Peronospora matthiolae TaxID=2874970 RepID=A0AAV1UG40_9STRA
MKRNLRLVTWNVNGLRAVLQRLGQRLQPFLESLEADIMCFQETKITRSELDQELVRPPGFDAFYSFCRHRGGYSGVVTFVKNDLPTVAAEEGLTGLWQTKDSVGHLGTLHNGLSPKLVHDLESEGRCVITDHQAFVLVNTYCPALASADRLEYKLYFHALLEDRVKALRKANKRVVVVGDINIAHREIDHCDPDTHRPGSSSFANHPCRKWMDSFLVQREAMDQSAVVLADCTILNEQSTARMVDTFRHLHPYEVKAFTCWNTVTGARQTNYGTRIDYILVDPVFLACVDSCNLEPERIGSDHCPVVMSCVVDFETGDSDLSCGGGAELCAKNFVEFSGMQQSIQAFVVRRQTVPDGQDIASGLEDFASTPLPAFGSGKQSRKPMKNRGQQSITSFFNNAMTKPKTASQMEYSGSEEEPPVHHMLAEQSAKRKRVEEGKLEWQHVLSGRPSPTPMCYCGQPTVLRSVVKVNENWGRKFYVCTKPAGEKKNPDARCDFFKWANDKGVKKSKIP